MKTKILLSLVLALNYCLLSAQVPQGFNYQAIARDGSGNPITNATMQVKIGILSDTISNTMVWEELFNPVRTNAFGMFNIVVGTGVKQSGSASAFSAIDWTKTPLFLRTSIYYPSSWKVMGTTKLQSVPYSMVAGNLEGTVPLLSVKGNTTTMDSALFVVRNNTGQIVFAVYNEGVRIYVDDGIAKGATKGGFAIGSFNKTKGTTQDYFIVNGDSIRAYIDTGLVKARKGGFAIGSFNKSKAGSQEYLQVTQDSIRMYINDLGTKARKGGFAIGGFDKSKGGNTNYLNVSTDASDNINPSQNRILWYPIKNAFLTGKVLIEKPDSVGVNSFASGYESKAKGQYSQALGYKAIARGDYSTAIGKNALANKINSFAFGDSSVAKAQDSYAFGAGAIASGKGSYAFGSTDKDTLGNSTGVKTTASGNYSFAIGQGAVASNDISFALGSLSTASGKGATAMGFWTIAHGGYSTALGAITRSYGTASTSAGILSVAKGDVSTAIGTLANANGYASTALGYSSNANADYSTSIGYGNTAGGIGSVSMGLSNIASGNGSVSLGSSNTSSGYFSTSLGINSTALCYSSLVIGRYNTLSGLSTEWNFWDPLFVIGNGSSETSRSNAMTVYKNGIADLGWFLNLNKSNTGTALKVNDAQAIWFDGTYFSWGYGGTYNVFASKVSVGTTASPGTFSLYVNGTAYSTGGWTGSDIRWKKNLEPLHDALPGLALLQGVKYNWRTSEFPEMNFETGTQIGLIAQEVEKIFPDLVRTDSKGFKAVSYDKLSVLLLEGMKEQQEQIESYKSQVQSLQEKVEQIESQQKELDELKTLVNTLVANQTGQGNK